MGIFSNFLTNIVNLDAAFLRQKGKGYQVAVTVEQDGATATGVATPTAEYISPSDFTAAYTSSSTITLTGVPFSIVGNQQIEYINVANTVTNTTSIYISGANGYAFVYSSGVITAYLNGALAPIFTVNDVYEVGVNSQKKAYDASLDVLKTTNQSPDSAKYVLDSLVATTNLTTASNPYYYPSSTGMSMDGFKHMSLTGQLIDAGTATLTVEISDDAAFANPVKIYGYDSQNNAMANQIALTNGVFSIDFDYLNYAYFRVKVVVGTNAANTVTVLARRVY